MRKAQASAALLLAGLVSVSAWSAPPADAALSEAQARKSEIDIELAWLSDPTTFACQLSVCWHGTVVELSGMVPNEPVRQRVIALAQQHSPLPVLDKLTVLPGSALETQPCNRDALCRTAVTRLAKAFGQHGLTFDINADANGKLTVAGVIPSYQDKLDVSRRLSQLPGCSAVINKLEVQPQSKAGRSFAAVSADSELLLPIRPASAALSTNQAAKPMTPPAPMAKAPATLPPAATAKAPAMLPPAVSNTNQTAKLPTPPAPTAKAPATLPPAVSNMNQTAKLTPLAPTAKAPATLPPATPNSNPAAKPAPTAKAPVAAPTAGQAEKTPAQLAKAPPAVLPATLPPVQAPAAKAQAPVAKAAPTQSARPLSLWSPATSAPASPYAMTTKTQANSGKTDVAARPLTNPEHMRPGQPVATAGTQPQGPVATAGTPSSPRPQAPVTTAGTPSAPRPQGPVAMAGTPSPGPRPAEERSFVPARPETAAVVPASLQQPASPAARPTVLPTSYQVNATKEEAAPAKTPAPAPRPLPPSVTTPAPQPAPPAVAAPRPPASQPTSPYANRPKSPTSPAPAAKSVQPAVASQPVPPPMTAKAIQPVSAAQPAQPTAPKTAERTFQPTAPAPRPMPPMMPATANVASRTAAAPTSPKSASRLNERMSSRPTTPDITPAFMSHVRQRVLQVTAGKARELQLQKVASDRLKISMKVDDPKEGEKLAAKILAITELGPFQVDLEVQLGNDK